MTLAIAWEPEIRGVVVVGIGVVVLCGSVWLLLATNLASRLGMLVALAGLFGWMFLMGLVWSYYGIGLLGELPSWQPQEIVTGPLQGAGSEVVRDDPTLSGWTELAPENPERGQAEASAGAFLIEGGAFASPADFLVITAYAVGGDPRLPGGLLPDAEFAVVQVQATAPQIVEPGQAPPTPVLDPDAPVVSMVMLRDEGSLRLPSVLFTVGTGLIFLVLCWILHERDKLVRRNREESDAALSGSGGSPVASG